ncbi:recombination protein O N-terminal domain-containing protein [Candidatus Parcubacteria bacterium]|nr:recombination protein O N-terminal domain-containing protein [Candidatus Parcubacteria bacterium]
MSYAVYNTRGFILGSGPSGEASKLYSIYTEDFGLVRAKAQSVRLLQSKLRYNLEDYSFSAVSLVKGREVWRLTGAENLSQRSNDLLIRARTLNLIRRLVQGEEKNEDLFDALLLLESDAAGATAPSEALILSHALSALGYLDLAALEGKSERERILAINKALKETQL